MLLICIHQFYSLVGSYANVLPLQNFSHYGIPVVVQIYIPVKYTLLKFTKSYVLRQARMQRY